jgi:hypothetical protein
MPNLYQAFALGVRFAHMAQVVEHSLGKGEVTGSNPVVGTNYLANYLVVVRVYFLVIN